MWSMARRISEISLEHLDRQRERRRGQNSCDHRLPITRRGTHRRGCEDGRGPENRIGWIHGAQLISFAIAGLRAIGRDHTTPSRIDKGSNREERYRARMVAAERNPADRVDVRRCQDSDGNRKIICGQAPKSKNAPSAAVRFCASSALS